MHTDIERIPMSRLSTALIPTILSAATISTLLMTQKWNQWGIEAMEPKTPASTSFADLANITLTADCLASGDPVEGCDPYGRPFQPYVVLPARIFNFLGMGTANTGALGVLLAIFFFSTIAILGVFIARKSTQPASFKTTQQLIGSQLLLALAAISPATILAVERGQIEQLTFLLVTASLLLLGLSRGPRLVGGAIAVFATMTKYLSIGMFLPFFGATRKVNRVALGALAVSALYLLVELPNLLQATEASRANSPQTTKSAFSVMTPLATALSGSPTDYAPSQEVIDEWFSIRIASLAIFFILLITAIFFLRKTQIHTNSATTLMLGSGGVLLLPYLIGANHDYRLIFLIPIVAAAASMPTSRLNVTMASASIIALLTSASMVPTPQGWQWPTFALVLGDFALMVALTMIAAVWLILMWRGFGRTGFTQFWAWSRSRLPDAGIITGITVFFVLISQRWTGLDTPDSSFYLSLGLFGSEVTDRAPVDSYYGTRLGHIIPIRALTEVFGTWIGLEIYRVLLMSLIVGAVYVTARAFSSRSFAAFSAAIVISSTVILSYLGNPYVTAPSMAGLAIILAAAVLYRKKPSLPAAVISGATLGWLAMVNPYGAILAGTLWAAIWIQATVVTRSFSFAVKSVFASMLTAVSVFGLYLLLGRVMFPDMNWLQTYLDWNAKLNYSDFASGSPVWLQDISLLIPLAGLILVTKLWWHKRQALQNQVALIITLTTIFFSLFFNPLMGGITLEAPIYTSMLWIPTLIAVTLAANSFTENWRPSPLIVMSMVVGVGLVITAGFITTEFNMTVGIIIMLGALIVAAFTIPRGGVLLIVGLSVFAISSQLVQDSRRDLGLYFLSPFSWAYQDNPIRAKVENSVKVQEWVLENTTPEDQLLVWVDSDWLSGDRDLFVAAGMQLWGENRNGVDRTLRPEDLQRIADTQPTAMVFYGPTEIGLETYRLLLPRELRASPMECIDFDWPTLAEQASACLVRLKKKGSDT